MESVVVANARRPRAARLVAALLRRADELGVRRPRIEWTTAERDGAQQAAEAVAAGAKVVVACGGDGTVRRVAAAVAKTSTDLAILPAGRANVAAHNLIRECGGLDAALLGEPRSCDIVRVTYRVADGRRDQDWFVSMAGFGWDAAAIRDMKTTGGWARYFASGARYLRAGGVRTEVRTPSEVLTGELWSTFVGNLVSAPPGIRLFPGAGPASATLVTAAVRPRGLLSWVGIATGRLLSTRSHPGYAYRSGEVVEMEAACPRPLHLDGDVIDDVVWFRAEVLPGALRVRCAA